MMAFGEEPARVAFGDQEHQHVSVPVAASILADLRRRYPVAFGEALARALVGPDAVRTRKGRAS